MTLEIIFWLCYFAWLGWMLSRSVPHCERCGSACELNCCRTCGWERIGRGNSKLLVLPISPLPFDADDPSKHPPKIFSGPLDL